MLREVGVYLKKDGKDVDLGTAILDGVPSEGDVLTFGTEHGRIWKVMTVHRHPPGLVDVFVEPADSPIER